MNKHPFSEAMREATKRALRNSNVTKTQIADATGNGNAWVTKLLDGPTQTIKEADMRAIEKLLGINYFTVEKHTGNRSTLATKIATMVDTDPAFAKLASALEEALVGARTKNSAPSGLPWFSVKELQKIGAELTRIVYAWDEAADPHYAKVGVEAVKFLAKFSDAHASKAAKKAGKHP